MSDLLIKLGKKEFRKSEIGKESFTGCETANKLLKDLRRTPHAFVLGCVMDKQIKAEKAWEIPYKISQELGSFSMKTLKETKPAKWRRLFKKHSLHRHPEKMAGEFYLAVHHIAEKYKGKAAKIWSGKPSSAGVVYRFLEFHGVGQKISTMAANILVRQFRVPMSDYYSIDISVDTHIRRVVKRMGLVSENAKDEMIIWKAREMHPKYPGIFDYACWKIGRDFCHPKKPPDCKRCPVRSDCQKIGVN